MGKGGGRKYIIQFCDITMVLVLLCSETFIVLNITLFVRGLNHF